MLCTGSTDCTDPGPLRFARGLPGVRLRAVPCSSQFRPEANQNLTAGTRNFRKVRRDSDADKDTVFQTRSGESMKESALSTACLGTLPHALGEIGRASCRERVWV